MFTSRQHYVKQDIHIKHNIKKYPLGRKGQTQLRNRLVCQKENSFSRKIVSQQILVVSFPKAKTLVRLMHGCSEILTAAGTLMEPLLLLMSMTYMELCLKSCPPSFSVLLFQFLNGTGEF